MDPVSAAAVASAGTAGATAATAGGLYAGTAGMTAASGLAASSLAVPGTLAAGGAAGGLFGGLSMGTLMTAGSLGLNVLSGIQAANAEGRAAELQAQGMQAQSFQEGLKAEEEAILRRERLIKALASQSAAGGAAGVSGGSAEALQLTSLQDFEREQRSANLMSRTQQDIYRRKIAGTLEAGGMAKRGELLSTATKLTEIG